MKMFQIIPARLQGVYSFPVGSNAQTFKVKLNVCYVDCLVSFKLGTPFNFAAIVSARLELPGLVDKARRMLRGVG